MSRLEFIVPSLPVAQPRPRAVNRGKHAGTYTPTTHPVNAFKAVTQLAAKAAMGSRPPLEGSLWVLLHFVFPRKSGTRKDTGRTIKGTRPDVDNLAKSVLDALNGLAYRDDGQIAALLVEKWHAASTEGPHVRVCVEELGLKLSKRRRIHNDKEAK